MQRKLAIIALSLAVVITGMVMALGIAIQIGLCNHIVVADYDMLRDGGIVFLLFLGVFHCGFAQIVASRTREQRIWEHGKPSKRIPARRHFGFDPRLTT